MLVAAAALASAAGAAQGTTRAWAACTPGSGVPFVCNLTAGEVPPGAAASAWAAYTDTIEATGWARVSVSAPGDGDGSRDSERAFAAGFVEAAITAPRIAQHYHNFLAGTFDGDGGEERKAQAVAFVNANDAHVRGLVGRRAAGDEWAAQLGLLWMQLDGLVAGYRLAASRDASLPTLGLTEFLLLNALVDLSSVIHRPFADPGDPRWTVDSALEYARRATHCSSIVKITPDFGELYAAHNTWTGYFTMLRAAKTYDLPFRLSSGLAAPTALFSGYFGILASQDDFFVLGSGLLVQETTNAVFNRTLLDTITPASVLTWARSVVANRVATDGPTWATAFSRENSGTINNQWMVVDYNKFVPRRPLVPHTLTVLEQIPGLIVSADMTQTLSYGYWPSYNRAFFQEIRERSGEAEMERKEGLQLSYSLYARAKIFRRDHSTVRSGGAEGEQALRRLMRSNDWGSDPLSAYANGTQSPELAIAARDDLDPDKSLQRPFGNTDAKYVSSQSFGPAGVRRGPLSFTGTAGPTHDTQPVFAWTGSWASNPAHLGHPASFPFGWEVFNSTH
eukprot:TRINITY_DN24325_c0_g1_i1.p1 TRINITY_DN24325_c0_g1~~TRINITY_DN24325_c0_g1_i1.p1  ORF type:complete len:588 (+),score=202.79 TRINITY_DN24325_c0_g1_i1:73-1764(+)